MSDFEMYAGTRGAQRVALFASAGAALVLALGCGGASQPEPTTPPPAEPAEQTADVLPDPPADAPADPPHAQTRVRSDEEPSPGTTPVLQHVGVGTPRVLRPSPDGRLIAVMTQRGAVAVLDAETGAVRMHDHPFIQGDNAYGYLQFDQSGTVLVASGSSRVPRPTWVAYDLHTGRRIQAGREHWRDQHMMELHPGGSHVAWVEYHSSGDLLRVAPVDAPGEGASVQIERPGQRRDYVGLWYSPDGQRLAVCDVNGVDLHDGTTGERLSHIPVDAQRPSARSEGATSGAVVIAEATNVAFCRFTRDRPGLFVMQTDGLARVIDPEHGEVTASWRLRPAYGLDINDSLDAMDLIGGGRYVSMDVSFGTLLYDTRTGEQRPPIPALHRPVVSADGEHVYGIRSTDRALAVVNAATGREEYASHPGRVYEAIPMAGDRLILRGRHGYRIFAAASHELGEWRRFDAGPFSVWRPAWRADSLGVAMLGRRQSAFLTADGQFNLDHCAVQANFRDWPEGTVGRASTGCGARRTEAAPRPEARRLASSYGRRLEAYLDGRSLKVYSHDHGTVDIRGVRGFAPIPQCNGRECRHRIIPSADERRVVITRFVEQHYHIWLIDLDRRRLVNQYSYEAQERSIRYDYTADLSGLIITDGAKTTIVSLDRRRREVLGTFEGQQRGRETARDAEIAAVAIDGTLHVYDTARGRQLMEAPVGTHDWWLTPEADRVVVGGEGHAALLDINTGRQVLEGALRRGEGIDGTGRIALRCHEGQLELRNVEAPDVTTLGPCRFQGPLRFSPNRRFIAMAESPYVYVYRTDGQGYLRIAVSEGRGGAGIAIFDGEGHVQVQGELEDLVMMRMGRPTTGGLAAPAPDATLLRRFLGAPEPAPAADAAEPPST